jgi:hypothetical protein
MKCEHCKKNIKGVAVCYKMIHPDKWAYLEYFIYVHPECYHKNPVKEIKLHYLPYGKEPVDENIQERRYEVFYTRSPYLWVGE